jgi:hypothetical protein
MLKLLVPYSALSLALCVNIVQSSTIATRRDLDQFHAEPTVMVHFMPSNMTSANLTSAGGFMNDHVTMFSAYFQDQAANKNGNIVVQMDRGGHYSHICNTAFPTSGIDNVQTTMSCSRIGQDDSQYTCTWIESTAVVLLQISTITWTYTTTEVVHTKTATDTWSTWSDLPPVTSSGVFGAEDHMHTVTVDRMVQPRTLALSIGTPLVGVESKDGGR